MTSTAPSLLRRLAALIVRGPEAPYVLVDLDDAYERDLGRNMSVARARWRYVANAVLSAWSLFVARFQLASFRMSWIDVRLGLRMLVKFPALTFVAVFALAIGIPVGLAPAHFAKVIESRLPEDPDGRVQLLRYWKATTTFDDLSAWRTALRSFEMLGGTRPTTYNIETLGGNVTIAEGAETTASIFAMLNARPRLGRTFNAADEVVGAPRVAVIGGRLWRSLFDGRADVLGETIRIGGEPYAVIGVMPDAFQFPNRQQVWLPVRDIVTPGTGRARAITILGRLNDGVSADQAQAELTSIAAVIPDGGGPEDRLLPEVVPTAFMAFGLPKGGLRATPDFFVARIAMVVPLLIACINVGLLIYARTATRVQEFAVRTALGASRARIVTQVFTESLVLALVATAAGLVILAWLPTRVLDMAGVILPYWMDPGITTSTVVTALALACASAAIAGVVPTLRGTGRAVNRTIQRTRASRSGVRLGGMASVLIVADVAVAMAAIGLAAGGLTKLKMTTGDVAIDGIRADHFLAFELRRPAVPGVPERQAIAARASTEDAIIRRLKSEPGVRAVAVASVLPRMEHPMTRVEVAEGESRFSTARTASVALDFFAELGQPVLIGRAFDQRDLDPGARTVIVNTTFVTHVLHGAAPLGQRVRWLSWDDTAPPSPWYEIVGVVGHLGMHSLNGDKDQGIYRPLAPGSIQPVRMAVELGADPATFAPRLREIALDADPQAVISATTTLDRAFEGDWYIMAAVIGGGILFIGVLLTLAASGVYAIMSSAVAERTREIGIRVALGADRTRIVLHVARRALMQIALGVLVGMVIAGPIFLEVQQLGGGDVPLWRSALVALLPGIVILAGVGFAACAAPTLRALRISPVESLRGD